MNHHQDGPSCYLCEERLLTAHPYLRTWFRRKKASYVNLHISCAYRDQEAQERAFAEHKSNRHFPSSPHNYMDGGLPMSLALDLFMLDEDGCAQFPPLLYAKIASENVADHEPIIWGGNFRTITDQDHFEFIQNPAKVPAAH